MPIGDLATLLLDSRLKWIWLDFCSSNIVNFQIDDIDFFNFHFKFSGNTALFYIE